MLESQQNETHLGAVLRRVDSYFEQLELPQLEADLEAPKIIAISDLEDCTNKDLDPKDEFISILPSSKRFST